MWLTRLVCLWFIVNSKIMELRFLLFIYNKDFGIYTITNSRGLKVFFFFFLPFLYPHIRISAPIQFHIILLSLTLSHTSPLNYSHMLSLTYTLISNTCSLSPLHLPHLFTVPEPEFFLIFFFFQVGHSRPIVICECYFS